MQAGTDGAAVVARQAGVQKRTVQRWMSEFDVEPQAPKGGPSDTLTWENIANTEAVVIVVPHDEHMFHMSWLDNPEEAALYVGDINPIPHNVDGFALNDEHFRTTDVCLTREAAMAASYNPALLTWFAEVFQRHQECDWSEMEYAEDRQANRMALAYGDRVQSTYNIPEHLQETPEKYRKLTYGLPDDRIWIITDGGYSKDSMGRTTILFPSDY